MVTMRDIEYDVGETTMVGRLALPDGDYRRPAVLIAHEGPGLDHHQRGRAAANMEAGVGGWWGTDRPFSPLEQRWLFAAQMRAAQGDWGMNLCGGAEHSFTPRGAERVDAPGVRSARLTDERSWRAMLDLF